ncbi:Undecaprenyl-phosphate 4-deoxy-4-formamido-L-arabinose transferase [subsurface metagenome]
MTGQRSHNRPKVIAAIPAHNEAKYIGTIVLKARQHVDEVMVVDDGSTDQTADVARLAGASVIRHQQNRGYGASVQTLLAEAKKKKPDVLVLLDADAQHNPDEIPDLIKPILAGSDLVIGSRERQRGNIPVYRRFGQRVLSHLSRILSRKKVIDSECGFRAFSSRAIAELKLSQNGMAISAETIAAAAEKGLNVTQIPISAIYADDRLTLKPVAHGLENFTWLITTISERRPLFFFGIAGIILIVLGVLAGFSVLNTLSATGKLTTGTALVSVLLFIIGIFSIFTGLILNALSKRR